MLRNRATDNWKGTTMQNLTNSLKLSPQGRNLFVHLSNTGTISAREAMADYGITSATLARRICDMEDAGIPITRETKKHPITGARYTRYSVTGGAN